MATTNGTSSALPALQTNPKAIFFTDFDGTITLQDSNDFMTDNLGFGTALRKKGNEDVLFDRKSFRDSFQEMLDSVQTPFAECIKILLANIKLDPKFKEFHNWCAANNVPIVVLSGGMTPVIKALLAHLVGEKEVEAMQIVSNDVQARPGKSINEEGGWTIKYHDDSSFGHDKSLEIKPYAALAERPIMFYAGDGVSDLSAAKETDLLFAKAGRDLVQWCERQNVPFTVFNDFSDIYKVVQSVIEGKTSVQDAATGRG
ncbi:HAD-like domain-containing protein [Pseudomassariella vexata]|uniref:HAD-like domain-containing protein n=1 Tax=Pseudomassariella vexata TaxID=1141098 RepID=A0A1Y2DUC4_9PEZI|nr:HAD-like domain-containing protein [Pseudomassariella vexata]ORY62892.1 HAD-like domain-containing protein [Pseudomassariella vexata]